MSICSSALTDKSSVTSMSEDELKQRMVEINDEQAKLKQIQQQMALSFSRTASVTSSVKIPSAEEQAQADARSVYVGNVDYSVTEAELEAHFHGCGSISRVTIPRDKYSGSAKGFAYIEFVDTEGRKTSLAMNASLLKGRQIKVIEKRTNLPGVSTTNRFPQYHSRFTSNMGLNRVTRGHGGVVVKHVYPGAGGRAMRGRPNPIYSLRR